MEAASSLAAVSVDHMRRGAVGGVVAARRRPDRRDGGDQEERPARRAAARALGADRRAARPGSAGRPASGCLGRGGRSRAAARGKHGQHARPAAHRRRSAAAPGRPRRPAGRAARAHPRRCGRRSSASATAGSRCSRRRSPSCARPNGVNSPPPRCSCASSRAGSPSWPDLMATSSMRLPQRRPPGTAPPAPMAASGPPALLCEGLATGTASTLALDGVDLRVEQGEIFGLLGPNGAGKTTTIRIANTLLPVQEGRIEVLGFDVSRAQMAVRRRIGYVPQQLSIEAALTGRQNVSWFARLFDVPRAIRGERVDEALEMMGLSRGGRPARRHLLRRHGAPARARPGARQPSRAARARRADRRARPGRPRRRLAARRGAARGDRDDGAPHDALHGGGRAPLRPHRAAPSRAGRGGRRRRTS